MTRHSPAMTEFLVGVLALPHAVEERPRPRAAAWVRAGIAIQVVLLAVVLFWVVAGQPGLDPAVRFVERHLGLAGGDVFAPASPCEPLTSCHGGAVNECGDADG